MAWPTADQLTFGVNAPSAALSNGSNLFGAGGMAPPTSGAGNLFGTASAAGGESDFLSGLGWNQGTAKLGLSSIGAIGNLWGAYQSQKLAKQQFDFTKQITERNMANQAQSYNTALDDRITSRAAQQGNLSPEQVAAYKQANRIQ